MVANEFASDVRSGTSMSGKSGSKVLTASKLAFNADAAAIAIALTMATLIRLNVIHRIGW